MDREFAQNPLRGLKAMSLTKPIPKKMREEMSADPFYKRCCVTGKTSAQEKIDWHHNFQFAGKRVNEKWCILPVCKSVHAKADTSLVRGHLDFIMLNRATDDELQRYSKAIDLIAKRDRLNRQYGAYEKYTKK